MFCREPIVKCGICYVKVCLSVRPCVTLVSHALTVHDIEICSAPRDRGTFLVSRDQICNTEFTACGRNDCVKQRHPLTTAKIRPIIYPISETCKRGRKLLLLTHRKSHTCFSLIPKLVTLNDLERRNGRYCVIPRNLSSTAHLPWENPGYANVLYNL